MKESEISVSASNKDISSLLVNLSDPKEFTKVVLSNFDRLDDRGSNGLSQEELRRAATRDDLDENSKSAAAVLLQHFESVRDFAQPHEKTNSTVVDNLFAKYLASKDNPNLITREDVQAIAFAGDSDKIRESVAGQRTKEIIEGVEQCAEGIVLGALGIGLEIGSIKSAGVAAGAKVAVPVAAVEVAAGTLIYAGKTNLASGSLPEFEEAVRKRRAILDSWNFQLH